MSKRKAKVCLDDFKLLKVIGKGTFGKVMLARHKTTSKECAIKVISKVMLKSHPNEIKHVMSERNVLRTNIRHPFLIGLQYSFQTPENLYFVLDYVNGGELFFHLQRERRFSEDRVRFYAAEIVSALEYLHTMNIVYRDLKPENILLDKDGHIALTDFGLAKEGISQHGSTTSTFCGTPEYLAPEILRKQSYGFSVDWWCLGTVIYEMLVGLPPFYSTNTSTLFDKILTEKLRFPSHVSFISRKLVAGLLVKLPARRLGSVGDASEVKTHEFFTGVDWNMVIRKEYLPPFKPDVEGVEDLKYIDPVFWEEEVAELKSTNGTSKVGRKGGSIRRKNDDDEAFAGFTFVGELDDVKREVLGDEGEDGEENGIVESNLSGVKEEGASTSGTTGVESGSAVVSNAIN
ncbi:serum/glucocorticoid regulated kinase 2 [Paraphysoderma sedebokerense]|nr:serum/glucocorticoid regulated kinase 2 [Paraphysoderma sedebokerense]